MNDKSLIEASKKVKRDKVMGILWLVLGTWVMLTSVYLGIAYRLDTSNFIWFNVAFGIFGIVMGFKRLNKVKTTNTNSKQG
jgi:hypothetical protein